jgi:hypothetical protein
MLIIRIGDGDMIVFTGKGDNRIQIVPVRCQEEVFPLPCVSRLTNAPALPLMPWNAARLSPANERQTHHQTQREHNHARF